MKSEVGTAVRPEGWGSCLGCTLRWRDRETERDTGRGGETDSRRRKEGPWHLEAPGPKWPRAFASILSAQTLLRYSDCMGK